MTKSVANCTRAQVVARRARTFFVPTTSAQAVTRTDESEKSQKRLPLTRPYWMALRCSSLMIGIAKELHLSAIQYRSEEHTSELQSRLHLVCRLLLEKKKNKIHKKNIYII